MSMSWLRGLLLILPWAASYSLLSLSSYSLTRVLRFRAQSQLQMNLHTFSNQVRSSLYLNPASLDYGNSIAMEVISMTEFYTTCRRVPRTLTKSVTSRWYSMSTMSSSLGLAIAIRGYSVWFLYTNLFMRVLPALKAEDAISFIFYSVLTPEKNSPFCCENLASSSNRKTLNSLLWLSIECVNRSCRQSCSACTLLVISCSPQRLRLAQKFFSGSSGMMQPPCNSTSCLCKYSKSLKRLETHVSYLGSSDLRVLTLYSLQLFIRLSVISQGLSMYTTRPCKNFRYFAFYSSQGSAMSIRLLCKLQGYYSLVSRLTGRSGYFYSFQILSSQSSSYISLLFSTGLYSYFYYIRKLLQQSIV